MSSEYRQPLEGCPRLGGLRPLWRVTCWVVVCLVAVLGRWDCDARAQSFPYAGLLRDAKDIPSPSASSHPRSFVVAADGTYFLDTQKQLWFTDGTREGTRVIPLVTPQGYTEIWPYWMTAFNGTLVFASGFYDPSGSVGCQRTSGSGCYSNGLFIVAPSKSGVELVREKIYIPDLETTNRNRKRVLVAGSQLYFFGSEQHDSWSTYSSNQLWRSDGTRQGTLLVHDLDSGGRSIYERVVLGGNLYFQIINGGNTFAGLWRSNGTFGGTAKISSADCEGFMVYANRVHFLEYIFGQGYFLSRLNAAGDAIEKQEKLPDSWYALNSASVFVEAGDSFYFLGSGSTYETKDLWQVNPTSFAMTRVAVDLREPEELIEYQNTLYFVATSSTQGRELYKLTANGAVVAQDIRPGLSGSEPENLTLVGNNLFFTADNGDTGRELWRISAFSNGVASLAVDIRQGLNSSIPSNLTNATNYMLLSADDGEHGIEPWILSQQPLGMFPTPTPTPTPTPRPGTGGRTSGSPSVAPFQTAGSWRRGARLWYRVWFSGRTREIVSIYSPRSARPVYQIQTVFGTATLSGTKFYVTLPGGKLRRGRYSWCVTSETQAGLRSTAKCTSLQLR